MWTRVFVRSFTMYRAILGRGFRIGSLFLLGSVERSSPGDCSHFVCALAKLWKQSNLVCRSRPGLVYLFDNNMGTLYWRIKAQGMVYVYKKYIVWTHRYPLDFKMKIWHENYLKIGKLIFKKTCGYSTAWNETKILFMWISYEDVWNILIRCTWTGKCKIWIRVYWLWKQMNSMYTVSLWWSELKL